MSPPAVATEEATAPIPALTLEAAPQTARSAGLRYVTDSVPGITRHRVGDVIVYRSPTGARITDSAELVRIKQLAVPPAWTDVWICPWPTGHLQATGRDARGRKQYRYHEAWRRVRDDTKYHRMVDFAKALPRIRARVDRDLGTPSITRDRVLASVVRLLDATSLRVGNRAYVRANGSFGLTTLRRRHVRVSGSTLHIQFRGKSGRVNSVSLRDRRVAAIVRRCQDLPGQQLFQYLDADGVRHHVDSEDVNDYIREAAGDDFTAKDFRTWAGTVLAAWALHALEPAGSEVELRRGLADAVSETAHRLGNTAAVCRRCYIHPAVISAHLERRLVPAMDRVKSASSSRGARLSSEEAAVVALLRRRYAQAEPAGGRGQRPAALRGGQTARSQGKPAAPPTVARRSSAAHGPPPAGGRES
jgi:DNA topoisomerase-1